VLQRFAEVAQRKGDGEFTAQCTNEAAQLQQNIELHGWDGA